VRTLVVCIISTRNDLDGVCCKKAKLWLTGSSGRTEEINELTGGALGVVGCANHVTSFFVAVELDINELETISSLCFEMSKPRSRQ